MDRHPHFVDGLLFLGGPLLCRAQASGLEESYLYSRHRAEATQDKVITDLFRDLPNLEDNGAGFRVRGDLINLRRELHDQLFPDTEKRIEL